MDNPHYGPEQDQNDYFQLLRFARISGSGDGVSSEAVEEGILAALNALSQTSITPYTLFLPLIYRNAVQTGLFDKLQPDVRALLRKSSFRVIASSINDQLRLQKTTDLFTRNSIPVILLKAAAFQQTIYPEDAPRTGVDIDLLVRSNDFETACALLSESMDTVVQSPDRLATHTTLFERVFQPRDSPTTTIEIHRDLTNPHIFNIKEQALWEDSKPHTACNSAHIRILSPEDTLLHLAVHAFRDLNFCTHNILDAHEVWCQWRPDPDLLFTKAAQWGAVNVLYYLLENARKIMGTPIAGSLIEKIKPGRFRNRLNREILQTSPRTTASSPFKYRAL